MVISGIYNCIYCGHPNDFGESFELPPSPFKIPCKLCGAPVIESVPEDVMEVWAQEIEESLTDEERALIRGEIPPPE